MRSTAQGRTWPFNLRISFEERALLRARAARTGQSMAAIVRRGLGPELDDERRFKRQSDAERT